MNTPDHGFWTYFLFRKRKGLVKFFVLGSLLPDVVYYVMFIYLGLTTGLLFDGNALSGPFPFYELTMMMFNHPVVLVLRQGGHSLVVWLTVFLFTLLVTRLRLTPWMAFVYGWLGHVVTDFLTHVSDAIPIFYPLSHTVIPGIVSYWEPQYYGHEFSIINGLLIVAAILYLLLDWSKSRRVKTITNRKDL
ncbi:hypothetical protein Q75_02415 [Bacillus coahuilensis p1.1.43]|uniref:Phospholipase C/D domain-containing protein n=1 Tax=Bacillus coahuilensis p1.1.43 TaxID=1150625 RepID=A0A147KBE3_9BACI|nr:zinc dependent phospholipase C family protein [Bacillus coahuilensis]KUP08496.1 hypothetical protein Q75_02415 [Bacillus coahuilensis p1.1.43]